MRINPLNYSSGYFRKQKTGEEHTQGIVDHGRINLHEPGMILEAKNRYAVDLSSACMIGDSLRDIECGRAAGCGYCILVKTGNGKKAEKEL